MVQNLSRSPADSPKVGAGKIRNKKHRRCPWTKESPRTWYLSMRKARIWAASWKRMTTIVQTEGVDMAWYDEDLEADVEIIDEESEEVCEDFGEVIPSS